MPEHLTTTFEEAVSWLPSWVDLNLCEHATAAGELSDYRLVRPRPDAWPQVAAGLQKAQRRLRTIPIADVVTAIDLAAEHWCERDWPPRLLARERAAEATGFSQEAVDRSLDAELRNYRSESLWRTLRRELGDPRVLDGPCPDADLQGVTIAVPPTITAEIFTGNIPGLPALGIVRALLVGSAVIAKVASGEPTFAALFLHTLNEIDARLGDAVIVTYWTRDDTDTRDAALAQADVVIAYGGKQACATLRAATSPHQRFFEHGHRLSAGVLSNAYLNREDHDVVAAHVARDASMFNQHACIAPAAYLVEGEEPQVRVFAERVARAMHDYARTCPRGELNSEHAATLALRRSEALYHAACSPVREMWSDSDWTVLLDDGLEQAVAGDRMLRVLPAESLASAVKRLRPVGHDLQNVAVGALEDEMPALVAELAQIGATRLCEPGHMPDPSLMWRHDGRMCIGELVRWCDVEMHQWASSLAVGANEREAG